MTAARNQQGFTLIELVVVITILGILAAFAVPRFVSLQSQARAAATEAMAGSVRSGAALAHSMWLVKGVSPIMMENQSVNITNGYPDGTSIANVLNDNSASNTGFNFTAGATATWQKIGATAPANCSVSYTPPAAAGDAPTIAVDTTNC